MSGSDKEWISAKMDVAIIEALDQFAERHSMSRSKALRYAIYHLVKVGDEFV
jgi:predicted transcriptional regulator